MADPTGLAVVVVDNDAVLTWAGSPTPYVADYSVFRRSPSTGAVFNPAGTPVASGITSLTYADNDLPTGSYDWQVFGRVVIPTVAPTITSPSSTSFTQAVAGSFTVTATGTPTPSLSMTGTLPAGVTFVAGTGVLAGTPTASGTFPLVFTAANGTLPNAVQNFTLTVAAGVTPPPVAGYVGWWDASDLASITAAAGAVSQWNDKSGTGKHVVQATGSNQPHTGTRTMNTKNVLDFDGGDRLLLDITDIPQPLTWFVVTAIDAAGVSGRVIGNGLTDNQPSIYSNSGYYGYFAGNDVTDFAHTWNTSPHQLSAVFNGASGSGYYLDGALLTSGDPGTKGINVIALGDQWGGGTGWDGVIAEAILYPSALSTVNRQAVEAYLKAKWGTP